MLKLYYNRLSNNARRAWITLLEKQLEFELIPLNLDGDQFQADFLTLNPFHHVPVLVDDGFPVVESLAILDYLEAKFPTPALLPTDAQALATVRMAELIVLNELIPVNFPFLRQMVGLDVAPQQLAQAQDKIDTVLKFFEDRITGETTFIKGQFTLADIVAGTSVLFLTLYGISFGNYPKVQAWVEALQQRESLQKTAFTDEEIEAAKPKIRAILQGA